jgi:hypothetical protein
MPERGALLTEKEQRNLSAVLEERVWYHTKPCLPRPRPRAGLMPLDPDYGHIRRHEWSDGNRGRSGGVCQHCHLTLGEVRLRLNPQKNRDVPCTVHRHKAFAQLIAEAQLDVPPIRFMGLAV